MAQPKFTKKTTADGKPYTHVELRGDPPKTVSRDKARVAGAEMSAAHQKGRRSSEINAAIDAMSSQAQSQTGRGQTARDRALAESRMPNPLADADDSERYFKQQRRAMMQYSERTRNPTFDEDYVRNRPPSKATVPAGQKAVTLGKTVPIQDQQVQEKKPRTPGVNLGELAASVANSGQKPAFSSSERKVTRSGK